MKFIKRVLISVLCFFAAITCYVFGIPTGGVIFFIIGLAFEAMFWLGIFGKKKK